MFKLDNTGVYSWPVTIEIPEDGRFIKAKVQARFRRLTTERLQALAGGSAEEQAEQAKELLGEVLAGGGDVYDEAGQPLEFSEENKRRLLDNVEARRGFAEAFWASLAGSKRAKN